MVAHFDPESLPQRIGPYRVLEKLATGGMAELYTAKQVGMEGFERTVAVKRILDHLADDSDFVQMFLDEARLVAHLNHPNIVQIFELGKDRGTYYIAMEYIHGRDLASIRNQLASQNLRIPPHHLARAVADACQGLHYAHQLTKPDGSPMAIVHRDVSPQNILVAFNGSVKLVDFGIAKAATKAGHTRAGVLKGKYGYMSPEQVQGKKVDARSDVFALGVVLYEMLTGCRPFDGENSMQTLKAVVQDVPRPMHQLNPEVPQALVQTVNRALEKSPSHRFQSAQELQLDLEDYIQTAPLRTNSVELSRWLAELFDPSGGALRADRPPRKKAGSVPAETADLGPPSRLATATPLPMVLAPWEPVGDDPWAENDSTHLEGLVSAKDSDNADEPEAWEDATLGVDDAPAFVPPRSGSGVAVGRGASLQMAPVEVGAEVRISSGPGSHDSDDIFQEATRAPGLETVDDPTIARPGIEAEEDPFVDATIAGPGLDGDQDDATFAGLPVEPGEDGPTLARLGIQEPEADGTLAQPALDVPDDEEDDDRDATLARGAWGERTAGFELELELGPAGPPDPTIIPTREGSEVELAFEPDRSTASRWDAQPTPHLQSELQTWAPGPGSDDATGVGLDSFSGSDAQTRAGLETVQETERETRADLVEAPEADARTRAGGPEPRPEDVRATAPLWGGSAEALTADGEEDDLFASQSTVGGANEVELSDFSEPSAPAPAAPVHSASAQRALLGSIPLKRMAHEPTAEPSMAGELDLGFEDGAVSSDAATQGAKDAYNQALMAPLTPLGIDRAPIPSQPTDGADLAPMRIGSTNVPPAALSMDQVLSTPLDGSSTSQSPPARARVSVGGRRIREKIRPDRADPAGQPAPASPSSMAAGPWQAPVPMSDGSTGPMPASPSAARSDPEPMAVPAPRHRSMPQWGLVAAVLAGLALVLGVFAARAVLQNTALLEVRTEPPGARVFVEGVPYEGTTPLVLTGLEPDRTYRVKIVHPGYESVEESIQLAPGRPAIWRVPDLVPLSKRGASP